MGDLRLAAEQGAIFKLSTQHEDGVGAGDGADDAVVGDPANSGVEEDGGIEGLEEDAGAGEEEVADAAVSEVEALGGVAHGLGVEIHKEGANSVLIRCADALPERMLALDDAVPLMPCSMAINAEAVAKKRADGPSFLIAVVGETEAAAADVADSRAAEDTDDLGGATAVIRDGQHVRNLGSPSAQGRNQAVECGPS